MAPAGIRVPSERGIGVRATRFMDTVGRRRSEQVGLVHGMILGGHKIEKASGWEKHTYAHRIDSLRFLNHTIHQLQLQQTGLLQRSILDQNSLNLLPQRLDIFRVCRKIIHNVRQKIRRSMNRRQRQSNLFPRSIRHRPIYRRELIQPIQRIGATWCIPRSKLALLSQRAILNFTGDDSPRNGKVLS